jgi:hypothetical protein
MIDDWSVCGGVIVSIYQSDLCSLLERARGAKHILFFVRGGGSKVLGRQPTRSGSNDARNYTAREMQELQAKTRAMYSSAHLLNMNDRQSFDEPLDECLDSRLSDIKACVKQLHQ